MRPTLLDAGLEKCRRYHLFLEHHLVICIKNSKIFIVFELVILLLGIHIKKIIRDADKDLGTIVYKINGKIFHVHRLEELMLATFPFSSRQSTYRFNVIKIINVMYQIPNGIIHKNGKKQS